MTKGAWLAVDAVGDSDEDVFDLAGSEVAVEVAEGDLVSESGVGLVEPAGGFFAGSEGFFGEGFVDVAAGFYLRGESLFRFLRVIARVKTLAYLTPACRALLHRAAVFAAVGG